MDILNQQKVPKGFEECPAKYMIMFSKVIEDFLNKPILTENEKFILKHISKTRQFIGRFGDKSFIHKGHLYVSDQEEHDFFSYFDLEGVFDWIKERRRI